MGQSDKNTHRHTLTWSKKPPTTGAKEEARRVRQMGKIVLKKEKS